MAIGSIACLMHYCCNDASFVAYYVSCMAICINGSMDPVGFRGYGRSFLVILSLVAHATMRRTSSLRAVLILHCTTEREEYGSHSRAVQEQ